MNIMVMMNIAALRFNIRGRIIPNPFLWIFAFYTCKQEQFFFRPTESSKRQFFSQIL
jgi:hypothetical protein